MVGEIRSKGKKEMRIDVTKKHIETAFKRNSHHCAIADAVLDSVANATYILVDLQSIRWTDKEEGERYIYLTPPIVQGLILKFDRGIKCHPISFQLNNPKIQKLRSRRRLDPNWSRSAGENLRHSRVAYKDREYGIRRFKK